MSRRCCRFDRRSLRGRCRNRPGSSGRFPLHRTFHSRMRGDTRRNPRGTNCTFPSRCTRYPRRRGEAGTPRNPDCTSHMSRRCCRFDRRSLRGRCRNPEGKSRSLRSHCMFHPDKSRHRCCSSRQQCRVRRSCRTSRRLRHIAWAACRMCLWDMRRRIDTRYTSFLRGTETYPHIVPLVPLFHCRISVRRTHSGCM